MTLSPTCPTCSKSFSFIWHEFIIGADDWLQSRVQILITSLKKLFRDLLGVEVHDLGTDLVIGFV